MKYLVSFLLYAVISLIFVSGVLAQTPTPAHEFDLCGLREGDTPANQEEYDACMACLYEAGEIREGYQWSVAGCIPTSAGGFTQVLIQFSSAVIGGIGFLAFMFGGYQILTSSGNPGKLRSGKILMTSSIITMLIVLFATFIFRFVAQDIIKIPGTG